MGNEFIATYKVPQSGARTELLCWRTKGKFFSCVCSEKCSKKMVLGWENTTQRDNMFVSDNMVNMCVSVFKATQNGLRKHICLADNAYGLKVIRIDKYIWGRKMIKTFLPFILLLLTMMHLCDALPHELSVLYIWTEEERGNFPVMAFWFHESVKSFHRCCGVGC